MWGASTSKEDSIQLEEDSDPPIMDVVPTERCPQKWKVYISKPSQRLTRQERHLVCRTLRRVHISSSTWKSNDVYSVPYQSHSNSSIPVAILRILRMTHFRVQFKFKLAVIIPHNHWDFGLWNLIHYICLLALNRNNQELIFLFPMPACESTTLVCGVDSDCMPLRCRSFGNYRHALS